MFCPFAYAAAWWSAWAELWTTVAHQDQEPPAIEPTHNLSPAPRNPKPRRYHRHRASVTRIDDHRRAV